MTVVVVMITFIFQAGQRDFVWESPNLEFINRPKMDG